MSTGIFSPEKNMTGEPVLFISEKGIMILKQADSPLRIQTAGDFAGMAPGPGNFVDALNTFLYGLRGKWKDFGFGVAAMLPIIGQGSTAAKYGKKVRRVDPATLRLPPTRTEGADPFKLTDQMKKYGNSTEGMPPIQVTKGANGELMINDGVTRATRIDTYNQIDKTKQTVPIEIIQETTHDLTGLPTVRNPSK